MTRSSSNTATWTISFTDKTAGTAAQTLTATGSVTSWKDVQGGVMETYGVNSCGQLPSAGKIAFSNISVSSASGVMTPSFGLYKPNGSSTPCSADAAWTNTSTALSWTVAEDVPKSHTFYDSIMWAFSTGLTVGSVSNNLVYYYPSNAVNRGSMAEFLYRLAGSPIWTAPATSPFADVKTTDTFYSSITWLSSQGVTGGVTTKRRVLNYEPSNAVNRGSMAAFMSRMSTKRLYCTAYPSGVGC